MEKEDSSEPSDEEIVGNDETSGEFAYEHALQNYLAKNLNRIEPSLRLYEEEDITGWNSEPEVGSSMSWRLYEIEFKLRPV